jgi:hypothetical protein
MNANKVQPRLTTVNTFDYRPWTNLCLWYTTNASGALVIHILRSECQFHSSVDKLISMAHSGLDTAKAA